MGMGEMNAALAERDAARAEILMLRGLVVRLPLDQFESSYALQAWFNEQKAIMEWTNPTWLHESSRPTRGEER